MLKKSLVALMLASAGFAAVAATDFYVVVPLKGRTVATVTQNIAVNLNSSTLPAGRLGQAYNFDLNTLLQVTGDPNYSSAGVTWSITNGALPANLDFNNGVVSGTPTVKNPGGSNFTVLASYKTKEGTQAYTIVVNGVPMQVTQISAGTNHACAITDSGGVKCWGYGGDGQLGDGTTNDHLTPAYVTGLTTGVRSVTASDSHTCAVTNLGGVKCWGGNWAGQLGDGTRTDRRSPVSVSGLSSGVNTLVSGTYHNCVLTTTGGAKCWGYGGYGMLGDGTGADRLTPVDVVGLTSGVSSLAAGGWHSCAVTTSGGAKCWGGGDSGQLGDNNTLQRLAPVDVVGLSSGVLSMAAGGAHTCAITSTLGLKCWGQNGGGQLGDGTTTSRLTPVDVSGLTSSVAGLAVGGWSTCAVVSGGAKCWGSGSSGQLGDGTFNSHVTPWGVAGLSTGVLSITMSTQYACAGLSNGNAKCWGFNGSGQLGDGTFTTRGTPVDVQQ